MACLSLLVKLEKQGLLTLPPSHQWGRKGNEKRTVAYVPHEQSVISGKLEDVAPLQIKAVESKEELALFKFLLAQYHYLGWCGTIGENMKYLARDRKDRPLACLLFGAAAWSCAPRDQFIGWCMQARKNNLHLVANNLRFLILPWVNVRYLASHILGQVAQRISKDWLVKYGHPLYLLGDLCGSPPFSGNQLSGC